MSKRHSVIQWKKRALQAAQMRCGPCCNAHRMVGIDMIAQDGNAFAHGHFDIETARRFYQQLGESIAEAEKHLH